MIHFGTHTSLSKGRQDSGVVVPLTAIMIGVLIFISMAFTIDVLRVKKARATADLLADELCGLAINEMPFVGLGVDKINSRLNGSLILNAFTRISDVLIVSPTPDIELPTVTPFSGSPALCSICRFEEDVDTATVTDHFPLSLWNIHQPQGAIGCVVSLEIDTIFKGLQTVRGKAAFGTRVAGPRPPAGEFKQVILAIDPALEVDGADVRFQFGPPGTADPGFEGTEFDPIGKDGFKFDRPKYQGFNLTEFVENKASDVDPNQMQSGCYNPHIAVRNLFLQALMERFSRFWFTRKNTHLMVINPRNENSALNPPTLLTVPSSGTSGLYTTGMDLTHEIYQLPFVNYADDGDDYKCPHIDCESPQLDRLFISQLRDCFHANAINGFQTIDEEMSAGTGVRDAMEHFEPDFFSLPQLNGTYITGDHWEQYMSGVAGISIQVTATDLVRVLGRVEECPQGDIGSCVRPVAEINPAKKPSGLQGDILGFLRYVNGTIEAFPSPGPMFSPYYLPGLIVNPEGTSPRRSNVILVLSKRLDPGQVAAIRQQVNLFSTEQVLTVVFIPTNSTDLDPLVEDQFLEAFNATLGSDTSPGNKVFIIADPTCAGAGAGEAECFRDYWENLLLPNDIGSGSTPYIGKIAENILWDRLIEKELIF